MMDRFRHGRHAAEQYLVISIKGPMLGEIATPTAAAIINHPRISGQGSFKPGQAFRD
jgi:hypothetical protein